jgi:hypothetical protein
VKVIGPFVGAWFNPLGALTSQVSGFWMPLLQRIFGGFTAGGLLKFVIGQAIGVNTKWLFSGAINFTASLTPQQFCSVAYTLCKG